MALAQEIGVKGADGIRNVAIDYTLKLDADELLGSVQGVSELGGTSDLSFSNSQVNSSAIVVNDRNVPPSHAVQFGVSGGVPDTTYRVKVLVNTDATVPGAQLFDDIIRIKVVD